MNPSEIHQDFHQEIHPSEIHPEIQQEIHQGNQQEIHPDFNQEIQRKIQQWKQGLSQEDLFYETSPECYEGLLTEPPGTMTRQELSRWREENSRRARKKFDERRERERAEIVAQVERERARSRRA